MCGQPRTHASAKETYVDLSYPAESERYRESIRATLHSLLPSGWRGLGALSPSEAKEFATSWRAALRDNGLLAPHWPVEYGGGGLSLLEQSILAEELTAVGAPQYPEPNDSISLVLFAPTMLHFGSEEQKARFLPGTLSGEYKWAQGYSEPEAGSDLFSLRTRAVRDGDTWRVSGQKIWQTAGTWANWIFTLVRTDPTSQGGHGLSFLLMPLDQPGITVRHPHHGRGRGVRRTVLLRRGAAPRLPPGGRGQRCVGLAWSPRLPVRRLRGSAACLGPG